MTKSLLLLAGVASLILLVVYAEDKVTNDEEGEDADYCDNDDQEPVILCKENEIYNSCVNGGCDKRNCSQVGEPDICIDPVYCKRGCVCADGYLRSKNGICVPKDQCDICGKDPNAKPGCGINCNRRCASYKEKDEVCIDVCYDGCDCKKGYVYDDNIKKCVKPNDCTPVCTGNEIYDSCVNGGCYQRNCSQIGEPTLCIDPIKCEPGCRCKDNYFRARNGTCVPRDQCDACGGDNNAHPGCGNCNKLCSNYKNKDIACIQSCKLDGCDCNDGYVYDDNTQKCVKPKDCTATCGKNEVFSSCTNGGCSARNCSQIGTPVPCIKLNAKACKPGCVCAKGYLRSINGTCVPQDQCDACGRDNNAKPGCGINCNRRCATYKDKNEFCSDICKVNGCDCKKGFVYDDNIKKCVKPDKCTPVCGQFEVFNSCIQGHCLPKNCTQIGKSIACPRIDPRYCKAGCLCQEGYLRATDGSCVPKDQCDACGGDVNAHPGCGVNCNKQCSNYNKKPGACPLICKVDGCDCDDGYVYDPNLKKCVDPEQCTPTCKENEVYNDCANGLCRPKNCTQRGWKIPCPPMVPGSCRGACICADGYLRAKNGSCVLEDQCDPPCADGEVFSKCPPHKCDAEYCPLSRNDPLSCKSTKECGPPRCICGFNRHRDRTTGRCIATASCPPFACDGPNEKYNKCPPVCPGENCTDYLTKKTCPKFRIGIVVPCKPQCRCDPKHYRNYKGVCVPADQCEAEVCPAGEVYDTCPGVKCDADYCPQSRTDPLTCPKGKLCNKPRCVCRINEFRDRTTGKCTANCPPFPCDGPREHYDSCPSYCPGEKCVDYLSNATCSKFKIGIVVPCRPACRCDEGSYRNYNDICIPKDKCKSEACAPGEIYSKCPAVKCDAEYCPLSRDSPSQCPIGIVCDRPRCICGLNRRRDRDTNLCIKEAECPPFACDGKNEEYQSCPSTCPGDNCSDYLHKKPCPVYIRAPDCKPDCKCKENYYRDGNGTCVTPKECKKCPKDHEFWHPCPTTCPPQNCTSIGKRFNCRLQLLNRTCVGACRCGDGYYRNDNNDCISERDCKRCTGDNEFWDPSPPWCSPQTCDSLKNPPFCPLKTKNTTAACRCIKDYYRDSNNNCIPKWDCPTSKSVDSDDNSDDVDGDDNNDDSNTDKGDDNTNDGNDDDNNDDDNNDDDNNADDGDENSNDGNDDDSSNGDTSIAQNNFEIASIRFAAKLINTYWAKNVGQSGLISPISILIILLELLGNSKDTTFDQISAVVNLTSVQQVKEIAPALVTSLQSQENITSEVANKIYCTDKYPLKESYTKYLQTYFFSDIENIDFSQSQQAAETMNDWVANKTHGLIKDLISSNAIDASTVLVILNAIYFKGTWEKQFNSKDTKLRDFYLYDNETIQVQTMYIQDNFYYTNDYTLNAQVVEIPYSNRNSSLMILVPNEINGIDELLKKILDPNSLKHAMNNLQKTKCKIYLPKFKTASSLNLNDYVKAQNVTTMFEPDKAEFVDITKKPTQLYVSDIVQKTFMEIDEDGSVAAAATGVIVGATAASINTSPPEPVVRVDHSSLYCIFSLSIPLFCGVYAGN